MSDINHDRSRVPVNGGFPIPLTTGPQVPYTGDEVNNTLNRGDKWVTIDTLMPCSNCIYLN